MKLDGINHEDTPGHADVWGVYSIAGSTHLPQQRMEYFNYEESGRGCYMFQDHVGLMARVYQHLKVLEQIHNEIIASRDLPQVQCARIMLLTSDSIPCHKLASLPIVLEVGILQFQMKQMAIFMEQVYIIYFGNFSGKPEMQAIIDSLRPLDMPMVRGVGANRKLPMNDPILTGQVSMIRSDFCPLSNLISYEWSL